MSKTAKKMFKELGLIYGEGQAIYSGKLDLIRYDSPDNYSTKVRFELDIRRIICYYSPSNDDDLKDFGIELFKAIQKQIEELGWK